MLTRSYSWDKLDQTPDHLRVVSSPDRGHTRNPSEFSHIFAHSETQLLAELEYLEHANKSLETEVENLMTSEKTLQKKLHDAKLELEMLIERVEVVKSEKRSAEVERDKRKKSVKKQKKKVQELEKKNKEIEKELRMYEELQTIRRQEFEMLQLPNSGYVSPNCLSETDEMSPSPCSTRSKVNLAGSLQAFKNQVSTLEGKIVEKQREIEDKDKKITRLTNKIAELGEPQEIIRALNLELIQTRDQTSKLEEELEKGREAEESMSLEIRQYQALLDGFHEEQKNVKNTMNSMENELVETKARLEFTKNECIRGECVYAVSLKKSHEEKKETMKSMKADVNSKEKEIDGLREKLETLENKLERSHNSAKRVKLMNDIALLHSDIIEQEMELDVLKSSLLNFTINLIDVDCLGCQHLESENQRIRGQRTEFQSELMKVKIQLAEVESELK